VLKKGCVSAMAMKLGIHLILWQNELRENLLPFMRRAADAGYGGVELSLARFEALPVRKIREEATALGLEVTCTLSLPGEFDLAADDSVIAGKAVARFKKAIDIACELGSPIVAGPWYGALGVWAADPAEREARRNRSASRVAEIGQYAEGHGVVLALEPLNRYESDLVNTVDQAIQYIRLVSDSPIGILLDTFHAAIEENSLPTAIQQCGRLLRHLHLAENHRGFPGTGSQPWREIFNALEDQNYQGRCVVEVIGRSASPIANQFHIWSSDNVQVDEAARRSYEYLQSLIKPLRGNGEAT